LTTIVPSHLIKLMALPKSLTTVTPFSKMLALLIFILFPFVGFYLGLLVPKQVEAPTTKFLSPSTTPSSVDSLKNGIPMKAMDFVKRTYSTNEKYFDKFDYPTTVANISEENLQGFKCTKNFFSTIGKDTPSKFEMFDEEAKKSGDFDNLSIEQLSQALNKSYEVTNNWTLRLCSTENGKYFTISGHYSDDTNKNGVYIAEILPDYTVNKIIRLEMYVPYYGCSKVLQLNDKNQVYLACGGGDVILSSFIYKVDLDFKSTEVVYNCTDTSGDTGEGPPVCITPK
jgi:hypothetical protein